MFNGIHKLSGNVIKSFISLMVVLVALPNFAEAMIRGKFLLKNFDLNKKINYANLTH